MFRAEWPLHRLDLLTNLLFTALDTGQGGCRHKEEHTIADTLQLPKGNGTRQEEAAAVASPSARFQSPGTCLWAPGGSGGANRGISQPPTGVPAVTWQWGCGGPQGCWGTAGRSPVGGLHPGAPADKRPCPQPAEPSCARRASRPVCLADTRVPVGVSEQPSGSWSSPRSLGSGQETPVTVGLLGLHWSEVITQQ